MMSWKPKNHLPEKKNVFINKDSAIFQEVFGFPKVFLYKFGIRNPTKRLEITWMTIDSNTGEINDGPSLQWNNMEL